ncbi:hypothetical protein GCM10022243_60950 [Saccharothrix violaceirubra]
MIGTATPAVRDHLRAARDAALDRLTELGVQTEAKATTGPLTDDGTRAPAATGPTDAAAPGTGAPEALPATAGNLDAEPEAEPTAIRPAEPEPVTHHENADDLAFPWEVGDPPAVVRLVRTGALAEAYWLTSCSGEPDRRTAALKFATDAFSHQDGTAVLTTLGLAPDDLVDDHDAATLVLVALLRAGLVAGWGHQTSGRLRPAVTLPAAWAELLDAAVDATRRGVRVDPVLGMKGVAVDGDAVRAEIGAKARTLLAELPRRKTIYQRASKVLRWFLRTDQPLHGALVAVTGWAAGEVDAATLSAALAAVADRDALIDAADLATRAPKQRDAIIADARRMLVRNIDEVVAVVTEALLVDDRLGVDGRTSEAEASLSKAFQAVADVPVPDGVAGAAVALLRRWLDRPAAVPAGPPDADVLLLLPDLPRTTDGRPDADDPRTLPLLATLAGPLDHAAAGTAYFERGDLRRAARLLDLLDARGERVDHLRTGLEHWTEVWTGRHAAAVRAAADLLARVRTQNLLEADERLVNNRLHGLGTVSDGRFDVARADLAELTDELRRREHRRTEALRAEVRRAELSDADRTRITGLLDEGDCVTATEFVAFARAGRPLPDHLPEAVGDLQNFVSLLGKGAEEGLPRPESAKTWARLAVGDNGLLTSAETALDAWDSLSVGRNFSADRFQGSVRTVLRLLGLVCEGGTKERGPRGGVRTVRVRAHPNDGSYVAELGSAATEYTVVVLTEESRGRSVLDGLDALTSGRANVVLCLHPLDLAARRALAARARRGTPHAIVIDASVVGYVAATAPGSWRTTQRITLPWAAFNPYQPFVAGLVPPEVFVGREEELSEVVDPNGGLFVYGGRQLGKSALLHRARKDFDDGEAHHAIYLDLKGRGVGESEPAARIWRELTIELKARGVLGQRVSNDAGASVVVDQVRAWLRVNPARRILLLADEADAFLTADSRATTQSGGIAYFPNVLRLKDLMESTDRRFKVVFAGLHQVQRFRELPNVPVAHGGPDIPIGPLRPADARRLVVEPMAALGYQFERPELVWRLLAATNYQASLVQIFCEELVRTLQSRGLAPTTPPTYVTEADVDGVAASDLVRGRIAERLRITINLEDRYRVLALVIACRSVDDAFAVAYPADELLRGARETWPAGFDRMTVSEVGVYLDEMVGLGLLIRLTDPVRYAVRSPNVVTMLGTRAELERELAEMDFDMPYEYNPRAARRLLEEHQGAELRSPLTDGRLAAVTTAHHLAVITGTRALGVDRVPQAVRDYAEVRGSTVTKVAPAGVVGALTTISRRTEPSVLVTDVTGIDRVEAEQVVRRLVKQVAVQNLAVVVLAPPELATGLAELAGAEPEHPRRWTVDTIRSWPECPFDVPRARQALIDATGGWPELVEDVVLRVRRGAAQAQALAQWVKRTAQPEQARRLLAERGVDAALVRRLGDWHRYVEPGDRLFPADIAVAVGVDLDTVNALVDDLDLIGLLDTGPDGIALDRVVHRCLLAT